eukprot:COSAG05_NODE_1215_length_5490_cov_153.169542_5_plen_73_part_01
MGYVITLSSTVVYPPHARDNHAHTRRRLLGITQVHAYKDDIWTYLGFLQDRGLKFDEDGNHTEEFARWLEQYK